MGGWLRMRAIPGVRGPALQISEFTGGIAVVPGTPRGLSTHITMYVKLFAKLTPEVTPLISQQRVADGVEVRDIGRMNSRCGGRHVFV